MYETGITIFGLRCLVRWAFIFIAAKAICQSDNDPKKWMTPDMTSHSVSNAKRSRRQFELNSFLWLRLIISTIGRKKLCLRKQVSDPTAWNLNKYQFSVDVRWVWGNCNGHNTNYNYVYCMYISNGRVYRTHFADITFSAVHFADACQLRSNGSWYRIE